MKRWRLPLLLLCLVLAGGAIKAQDGEKVLRFAAGPGDPRSIDPQQAIDTRDWYLLNVVFPSLTTLDEESGQVEPGIVTGWDVSDDSTRLPGADAKSTWELGAWSCLPECECR